VLIGYVRMNEAWSDADPGDPRTWSPLAHVTGHGCLKLFQQ